MRCLSYLLTLLKYYNNIKRYVHDMIYKYISHKLNIDININGTKIIAFISGSDIDISKEVQLFYKCNDIVLVKDLCEHLNNNNILIIFIMNGCHQLTIENNIIYLNGKREIFFMGDISIDAILSKIKYCQIHEKQS